MTDGQPTEKPESEKILEQIDALKSGEVKESPAPVIESAQSTESAPKNESEDQTASAKSEQAVTQDVKEETPAKADKSSDDVKEWARKKGIKSADDAFRSLRELERKMHRMTYEEKQKQNVPQGTIPAWQPAPQMAPPPYPQYPPAYPYPDPTYQERMLEAEAARRGWDKEDFKKVLDLANEVSEVKVRRIQQETNIRYAELEKESRRNTELFELMKDPYFTNEKVQFEMHRVLEENPDAFKYEPSPYRYAYDEAQKRLARKYLQGETGEDDKPNRLPKNPPKEGTTGTSPSFEKTGEQKVLEEFSKAKDADGMRAVLSRLGAVPTL